MEKNIKETDFKVKNLKTVPPSTTADAGKVLTVNEDGSISWQQKGEGGGMKAFFDAGGKCGYSKNSTFEGIIAFADTSNVTEMNQMFSFSQELETVPLFDTSKVIDMNAMFSGCESLSIIPAFDVSNVMILNGVVNGCYNLTAIHFKNIADSLKISSSTKFTREALLEIIGNLKTVTTTHTLTMGATNLAKLTEEDKAIATNKGWTLA